jgi:DegV family protein with EDD domain
LGARSGTRRICWWREAIRTLHVVTDSSCDIPNALLERYAITLIPMSVDIDGVDYLEGVDITPAEFFEKMARSPDLPKTSQPAPAAFAEAFDALAGKGQVLCVTVSSKLSGTYQSACLATQLSGADVTVFDSLNASLGHGLQVLKACELAAAGRTLDEIVAELTAYRDGLNTLVLLNTLENIVRGGRLSRFQGSVGKVLDIRVLLHNEDGEVVLLEKVHGRRKLMERALQTLRELRPDLSGRDVGITHFSNREDTDTLVRAVIECCHPRGFVINEMGSSMAAYAGEGGIILSF